MTAKAGFRLNLEIGSTVKMELNGSEVPVNSRFIGMEHSNYLIFRLPAGSGISDYLYEGNKTVVKYVGAGRIYGFQSSVMAHMIKKGLIVAFLRYPEEVEVYELRKYERVECFVPAKLAWGDETRDGYVLDISPGGCRFGFPAKLDETIKLPEVEDSAHLSVVLFGIEGRKEISCIVKSVFEKSNPPIFGLKFDQLEEEFQEQLQDYVDGVKDYLTSSQS